MWCIVPVNWNDVSEWIIFWKLWLNEIYLWSCRGRALLHRAGFGEKSTPCINRESSEKCRSDLWLRSRGSNGAGACSGAPADRKTNTINPGWICWVIAEILLRLHPHAVKQFSSCVKSWQINPRVLIPGPEENLSTVTFNSAFTKDAVTQPHHGNTDPPSYPHNLREALRTDPWPHCVSQKCMLGWGFNCYLEGLGLHTSQACWWTAWVSSDASLREKKKTQIKEIKGLRLKKWD